MSTLEDLISSQRRFVRARDWEQFHSPKNLAMALGGEVGELCLEIAPMFGEDVPPLPAKARASVHHEVGDVTLYLLRLYDVLHVDPTDAFIRSQVLSGGGDGSATPKMRGSLAQAVCQLSGSVGMVLEVFQWQESGSAALPSRVDGRELERRLHGVSGSLWAIAEFLGIDVLAAAEAKLAANELRYPVSLSRGSSRKYTELMGEDE
ncbi:nucleotide pyrophosphohydrolase [Rhodococcus opacus]|uniref:nucleotide pyrophosphohydrolase n=1 Tax=Rhodococcus opacus TaxID=37919 RepID=UPI002954F861|nr:nucleotide pyrophosphohydrolase [Rhodococcus opacus]MDV7088619.1 nucleotide pyrophosphohydrolase [Rhodococcus opacus]